MTKASIFSILNKSHYAQISKETIEVISDMLIARSGKTNVNLCELIEKIHHLVRDMELDYSYEVKMSDRAQFVTFICMLVKFLEPMMEQLETIIDKEIGIHKIKA